MSSQSKEFPSLLFAPQASDRQADGYLGGRSPGRSTRSPSTPAYGRSSVYREGSASRRRSLTPTGSLKDTPPPPPPAFSLLDPDQGRLAQLNQELYADLQDLKPVTKHCCYAYHKNTALQASLHIPLLEINHKVTSSLFCLSISSPQYTLSVKHINAGNGTLAVEPQESTSYGEVRNPLMQATVSALHGA